MDAIDNFSDINKTLLKNIRSEYTFAEYDDYAVFYKIKVDSSAVPGVTDYIRIYSNLYVKLPYKGYPLPLPSWFVKAGNTSLNKTSVLENCLANQTNSREK